jgi:hypothetical protein
MSEENKFIVFPKLFFFAENDVKLEILKFIDDIIAARKWFPKKCP